MRPLRAGLVLAVALCSSAAAGPVAETLDEARELYRAGRIEEAVRAFRRVAVASEAEDPATAGTARNNACVLLMNSGDHRAAHEECEHALRLRRMGADPARLAPTLNNLGLVLQYLGRFEESERRFEEALSINTSLENAEGQTLNLANLGVLATQAGRYAMAIDRLGRASTLAERHQDEPWAAEQRRLAGINLAVVFERLGAYDEALSRYRAVYGKRSEMTPHQRAALLVNLGVVYRNLGDPVRALRAFDEATPIYQEVGDRAALSNLWLNIGILHHLNLDDPNAAETAYRRALQLAEASGDRNEEIQDLYHLGRLLLEGGRADEARAAFTRCREAAEAAGSIEGAWTAREGLARFLRARNDLPGAWRELSAAMAAIEGVRESLTQRSLRSGYFAEKRFVYEAAVEVLAGLDQANPGGAHAEEALAVVQRAKARALLDALGHDTGFAKPLDARSIAKRLGEDALLEYFVGEEHLFLWRVHGGRVEMECLGDARGVLDDVEAAYRSLAAGAPPPSRLVRTLSETLLRGSGPIVARAAQIRIAPDGPLHYLPFEILAPPEARGMSLVETATVSYLPSGSALDRLRRGHEARGPVLLGFGDPEMPADTGGQPTPANLLMSRFDLGPLPAAADELRAIARWLPGRAVIRTGSAATEEAFVQLAQGGARVLHLVSHTVVDDRNGRAAILLTRGEASDGLLRPEEIARLDLPVDLTVLAACRTALGAESSGDALSSLTGSFLAAGSSAVLATLWDVGDAETRAFSEQFYFELRAGEAPAEALRRAKLRMLADPAWGRTDLWAAYVLVGDAGPIRALGGGGSRTIAAAAAVVAAAMLAWLAVRALRSR